MSKDMIIISQFFGITKKVLWKLGGQLTRKAKTFWHSCHKFLVDGKECHFKHCISTIKMPVKGRINNITWLLPKNSVLFEIRNKYLGNICVKMINGANTITNPAILKTI